MNHRTLLVLAAGKGTRMRNRRGKVLHPLAGRSLIGHVVALGDEVQAGSVIVVLSPGADKIAKEAARWRSDVRFAVQETALGTGDAVKSALPLLPDEGTILVLFGDTPLLTAESVERLAGLRESSQAAVVVMGMAPEDPLTYGRLRFDGDGNLLEIVEHVDADADLRRESLCNSGVMAIDAARIRELIDAIPRQPANGEYYLTDIVAAAISRGWVCRSIEVPALEGHGVNSQAQLAEANALLQGRMRERLLDSGVIMQAPETVQLAYDTKIEPGAEIEAYVVFGPGVTVKGGANIRAFSHVEGAVIEADAVIGPYARLRPGSHIGEAARIGNFVETKNVTLGSGAKANHLTYLGDASIGEGSNIGAGTITCNYDGFSKWQTRIGEGVFIGSNTALVAPVSVGDQAVIGAGSVITSDISGGALALTRAPLSEKEGRASALRKALDAKKQQRQD